MTPIADMVSEMMARGIASDVIVMAVKAAELASASGGIRVDDAAERRRAWDREYRRKRKENRVESGGIRVDAESALSSSSSLESNNSKESKKERKRGAKIPPDWRPNAEHSEAGRKLGYSEREIDEQAEDMRLWAQSNEHRAVARKSDWDLTFHGWLCRNKPKGSADDKSILGALNKMYPQSGNESGPTNIFRLSKG